MKLINNFSFYLNNSSVFLQNLHFSEDFKNSFIYSNNHSNLSFLVFKLLIYSLILKEGVYIWKFYAFCTFFDCFNRFKFISSQYNLQKRDFGK